MVCDPSSPKVIEAVGWTPVRSNAAGAFSPLFPVPFSCPKHRIELRAVRFCFLYEPSEVRQVPSRSGELSFPFFPSPHHLSKAGGNKIKTG